MDVAKRELGKHVKELAANDSFITELRAQHNLLRQMEQMSRQAESFGQGAGLLGRSTGPFDPTRFSLLRKTLEDPIPGMIGKLEADRLRERNPEINKYFAGLRTDPGYDRKGRSWDVAPTHVRDGQGRITAWCAAFVNWCLGRAGAPRLGYATARSWLDFGTPVAHPVYGCITIIKPSRSTGSTTGHVAFYIEHQGMRVRLLGGNQHDMVCESSYPDSWVLGYRWPTRINHYLMSGSRRTMRA
jgi:uncharacterized protein (TIGR02594 family)